MVLVEWACLWRYSLEALAGSVEGAGPAARLQVMCMLVRDCRDLLQREGVVLLDLSGRPDVGHGTRLERLQYPDFNNGIGRINVSCRHERRHLPRRALAL